ncbi:MAG: elongation factor P [Planctomycetes bacterium]|nr:elongation factor P [Planctomycetota bacterium]
MSTISTSDFRKGVKIEIDGKPYLMEACEFTKPGKGQAVYKTKLRNLLDNTLIERTYRSGDTVEAADVHVGKGSFLYKDKNNFIFMDSQNYEQYAMAAEQVGQGGEFLLEGTECELLYWNNNLIGVTAPSHMVLEVTYTEQAARGNTATNVTKPATLETGGAVNVPAFINTGDKIKVDTRTGEYIERVRG